MAVTTICFPIDKRFGGAESIRSTIPKLVSSNDAMCILLVSLVQNVSAIDVAQFLLEQCPDQNSDGEGVLDCVQKWCLTLEQQIQSHQFRQSSPKPLNSTKIRKERVPNNSRNQEGDGHQPSGMMTLDAESLTLIFSRIRAVLVGRQLCRRFRDELPRFATVVINVTVCIDEYYLRRSQIPSADQLAALTVSELHNWCKKCCVIHTGSKRDIMARLEEARNHARRAQLEDQGEWHSSHRRMIPDPQSLRRLQERFPINRTRLKLMRTFGSSGPHHRSMVCRGREDLDSLLSALSAVSAVSWLDLRAASLSEPSAAHLLPALTLVPSLTRLDLAGCPVGDTGAESLGAGLAALPCLASLELCDNGFGPAGATALGHGLRSCTRLGQLSLTGSAVGPAGAAALASGLAAIPCLTQLSLAGVGAAEAGAEALAGALGGRSWLRELDLSRNALGRGVAHLAALLAAATRLETLLLQTNQLGPDEAPYLAAALRRVPRLASLSLGDNPLGPAGAGAVAPALPAGLTCLCASACDLRDEGAASLASALRPPPAPATLSIWCAGRGFRGDRERETRREGEG